LGKASITIAINGKWNGKGEITAATSDLGLLNKSVSANAQDMAKYLTRQEDNAKRVSRLAAATSKSNSDSLVAFGNSLVEQGGRIYRFGEQAAEVGDSLTKNVTLPMVAFGALAGKSAVDYDTAMANVRKTTDMTEAELKQLGEAALESSKSQPVTAEAILNVEALGAQLDVSDDKLQSFAQTVSGLDIATNMDADTAATDMARFANIVGMSEDEYSNFGSTIVAIGNNMATTESEVANMSLRFASAGHQAGLSESQILGMSAAMSSLGIKSEMGGSALSQIFVDISKSVALGGESLDAYAKAAHVSADEFASAWRDDAAGAFVELLQGIQDSTAAGEDMNVILGDLGITQIRQSDVMRRMAGSVGEVTDALGLSTQAWQDNTALQAEVDTRNESMASRLQVLKNRAEALGIQVGGPLVNALIDVLDESNPLIGTVETLVQSFADADQGTQQMVIGMAGVAAASGPVLSVVGRLTEGIGSLTASFGHAVQDVGVYEDAMSTVDGSQMRVYASAKTTATNMGLLKNKVAEAAGGVDRYVSTWEDWYSASGQAEKKTVTLNKLVEKQTDLTGKAARKNAEMVESLRGEITGLEATRDANAELMDGWKQTAGVMDSAGNSVTTSTGLLTKLKDGVKLAGTEALGMVANFGLMMGVSAVIGLVAAAVADYAAEAAAAQQRADDLASASRGLADIEADAASGATSMADGIGDVGERAEKTLQNVIDLNDKYAETFGGLEVSRATLSDYIGTIEELAGQTDLTAYQQERLKLAVEGYNSITGDTLEVTDAVKGELSESTDEINRNADAWERNARSQAMQEAASEYLKEEAQARIELEGATDELSKRQERYNELHQKAIEASSGGAALTREEAAELQTLSNTSSDAAGSVAQAQGAVDSATTSLNSAAQSSQYATQAASELNDAYGQFASTANGQTLEKAGVNVDDLSDRLRDLGADTDALNGLTSDDLNAMVATYGTSTDGIIRGLEAYGVSMDQSAARAAQMARSVASDIQSMDNSAATSLNGAGIDVNEFARKMVAAGVTSGDLNRISTSSFSNMAQRCGGDMDQLIGMIKTYNQQPLNNKYATTSVDYSSLRDGINYAAQWNNTYLKTLTGRANYTAQHVGMASGGLRYHADGGIVARYHANGGAIATRATPIVDIVGEAGAEAVIPLTNKRYVRPFAATVAEEMGRYNAEGSRALPQTVNYNYSISIDGTSLQGNARANRALAELVDALDTVSRAGVSY
jgi:TP901 family phage tail tape measure protein